MSKVTNTNNHADRSIVSEDVVNDPEDDLEELNVSSRS